MNFKLLLIVSFLIAAVVFYFAGGLDYLSLSYAKQTVMETKQWLALSPVNYILLFCVFVLILSTPLPAAGIVTLSAGFLFGFWYGFIFISFATAIGAVIGFSLSRYLLRDFVVRKFGQHMHLIEKEFDNAGFWYALSLRFIPGIPFFGLNALLSLTSLRITPFYFSTLIGMVPVAAVIVNAGSTLMSINSMADILTFPVLFSLLLLALLPITVRFILKFINSKAAL